MSDPVALGQPTVGEEELAASPGFRFRLALRRRPDVPGLRAAVRRGRRHRARAGHQQLRLGAAPRPAGCSASGPATRSSSATTPSRPPGTRCCGPARTPVFADVRPDIWSVDPAAVEAAITARTVGIIAVDVFGQPADYDELARDRRPARAVAGRGRRLLGRRHVQGPPGRQPRRPRRFTFHGRKGITAGEGGALDHRRRRADRTAPASCTPTASSRPQPRGLEPRCRSRSSTSSATTTGCRTSQAAIMLVQLDRLPDLLADAATVAAALRELLADARAGRRCRSTCADRSTPGRPTC